MAADGDPGLRIVAGRTVGLVGVALYNWWAVAVLAAMVTGPDQFFSDLEAEGRSRAVLLGRLDTAAGGLILLALLLRGSRARAGPRSDWPWMLVFAGAAVVGGRFPYVCAEGVDTACRAAEWRLQLPLRHYLHATAGICEFAAATAAVGCAWARTVVGSDPAARWVRALGWVLICCYPALAVVYIGDRYGAFVEPVFFISFSAMVLIELFEAPARRNAPAGDSAATRI